MQTGKQTQALRLIDQVLEILSRPLPPVELENGWGEPDRLYFTDYFARLRKQIAEGNATMPYDLEYINLSRSMDDRGISRGQLLHRAAEISTLVRENYREWSA
jgi:hypothetical protein